jgi:hypothetical protein
VTKSVPTAIELPSIGEIQPGKPVLASTWRKIVAAQHYVYGRQGAHILNVTFDPPWRSLAFGSGGNAYHSVGQSVTGGLSLDHHTGLFMASRQIYDTGSSAAAYSIALNVYARNLNVRATLVRLNTEDGHTGTTTSFTGLVTTHGADAEWDTVQLVLSVSDATRSVVGGLAFFLVYIEALVPASGDGYIHHVGLRENVITAAAAIPRGT